MAQAARVSTATAYRHFPNPDALWRAVLETLGTPDNEEVFADLDAHDIDARVAALMRKVAFRRYRDESLWPTAELSIFEARPATAPDRVAEPSGRRLKWIDGALSPLKGELTPAEYRRLCHAMAMVTGAESMLSLRDVCGLSPAESKRVSLWASHALVSAARAEARKRGRRAT